MTSAIDTSTFTQGAMSQAQAAYANSQAASAAALTGTGKKLDMGKVKQAAQQFEAFFVGQMMEYMSEGIKADQTFGGGQAEDTWRSMLNQEYGKEIAKTGQLGIADKVMKSMIAAQEKRDAATTKLATAANAGVESDAVLPNAAVSQAAAVAGAAARASQVDVTA